MKINFNFILNLKLSDYGIPLLYLVIQGYHVIISFMASIFLQKTEYGLFKLIETYCGLIAILVSCGMTTLLIRFSSKNDWENITNEYIESLSINIIIAAVLLISGVILFYIDIIENLNIETIILIVILSFLTSQIKNCVAIFVGRKMPLLVFGKFHYAFFFAMILAYLAIQNKDAITWIKLKLVCEAFILSLLIYLIATRSKYDAYNKLNLNKLYDKFKEGAHINLSLFTRIGCDSIPVFVLAQLPGGKTYAAEWGIAALAVFFLNTGIGLYFQKCMPDLFRSVKEKKLFDHKYLIKNALKVSLAIVLIPILVHLIQHKYISWVDLNTTNIFIWLVFIAFIRIPVGVFGAYCTVQQKYWTQIKLNIVEISITISMFYLFITYFAEVNAMLISIIIASLYNSAYSYYALQKS